MKGDIDAAEILIAGIIYGNLKARERIEITETGSVMGDLITKTLVIDEGASFKGNCTMEVVEEKGASGGVSGSSETKNGAPPAHPEDNKTKGKDKEKKKGADSAESV